MGTLHKDVRTFITSRAFLLRMKMFQTKVVEKIKTPILCSMIFLPKIVLFGIM